MTHGFRGGLGLAATAVVLASAGHVAAATFYVDANAGTDRSSCVTSPGTGAAACKTIMYVVNNVALAGGDVVQVAPGVYREQVTVTATDDGSSAAGTVVFRGAGVGQTFVYGLDRNVLPDSDAQVCSSALNCAGDGLAYPNVYRFDVTGRTVVNVYETIWSNTVRVDDRPTSLGGQCTSGCTDVVYDFDRPIAYKNVTGVTSVQNLSGSWYRSGNYLFVHTFNDVAPTASTVDVETASAQYGFNLDGSSTSPVQYVTVEGFTVAYANINVRLDNADYITLLNLEAYSGATGGLDVSYGSDYLTVRDSEFSNTQQRGSGYATVTAPCDKTCGWVEQGTGNVFSITNASGATSTGHVIDNVTVRNGWNGVSVEQINNSRFTNMLVLNSPNHPFVMNGFPTAPCDNVTIEHSVILNGQEDGIYNAGCQNLRFIRNAADATFLADPGKNPSSGGRHHSNLKLDAWPINVCTECTTGWASNHNWYPRSAYRCRWAGTSYNCRDDGSGTDWSDACGGCDRNAVTSVETVPLAGLTWPPSAGLALSRVQRADFYPVAASTAIIDQGNPDLDGDGVLETGPGGDDECTLAHHCYGAGPDIGPFEYGIDGAGNPPSNIPPPGNVRRIDRSGS